jgi:hypothetical protein
MYYHICFFFLFSIISVNNDPDGADEDKEEDEDDSYNGEDEIDDRKLIGCSQRS